MTDRCPTCDAAPGDVPGWCDGCGTGRRVGARELLGWLVRDGRDLPTPPLDADPLRWPGYAERRREARAATGLAEAVVAVEGTVGGAPAVVVAWDFSFLGGSMSSGVGAIVAAAYDHARVAGLPIVLLPSTGGARMQEGMASLVQMAATTVAAGEHARAGLLQVTVLRDPTTGGVFASHANLSDVLLAEPGATIGFAGPRVAEAMTGGPLPEGSHTAEGAAAAGLVDAVVPRPELPSVLGRLLAWAAATTARADGPPARSADEREVTVADAGAATGDDGADQADAWREVERARAGDRARTPDVLAAVDVAGELRGDRAGDDDPTIRVALARWDHRPVVVVAMDVTRNGGRIRPAGYRKAWRGLALAERLRVPVVTIVDTPGADASAASEAGGVAAAIARTAAMVLALRVPVVSLVIGEGGSGGALALAVGDRLLIQEHAVFSVIAPEGAAAILHRDAGRAADVAALLDPTSHRLRRLGIADEVVPEPAGQEVATAVAAVARHLRALAGADAEALLAARAGRWRTAGQPT